MTALDSFLRECTDALGPEHVVTDPDVTASHCVDWTRRWRSDTPAVLRPGAVEQVAQIVGAARRHHIALVPQGGNTGLVGGSVPHSGEVVVDLRRLDQMDDVDVDAAQVTVGAGVPLARLQHHVATHGLAFGVDLGSRDTATLGGMVATNAGGVHVLRHGGMRAQLLGIEAVLGTGEVLRSNLSGLLKDNTGYDLPGLLCGSEGTLGIVTAMRLRLAQRPDARVAAIVAFDSPGDAVANLPVLRSLPSIHAVEMVLDDGLRLVADHLGAAPPFDPVPPCAVLIELAGSGDLMAELGSGLSRMRPAALDTAVAEDEPGVARLWRWREAHTEAAAGLGVVHKADVSLPIGAIPTFVGRARRRVHEIAPAATVLFFGHLADGNLHVNVVAPHGAAEAIEEVFGLVVQLAGSVSAEHGIGVAKKGWLERQRGREAVDTMRRLKSALDPDGVLNPAVLFA